MEMKNKIKVSSLDEVRAAYKEYLNTQGLSKNTIMTSSSDAFYIWNKRGRDTFWNVIYSDDFESLGKTTILETLKEHSSGNAETNVNGYMAHLRRFRRFLENESAIEIPESIATTAVKVKNKPRKMKQNLPYPSIEQVEYYLAQWDSLEDYHLQEDALDKLFFELCPENTNISDVLLKVATLNDFYSTNIFKVYPLAKHIVALDIDDRLKAGDVNLIGDIQKVNGINIKFYSFATKYCSHHKPLDYPIYDSYVYKVLRYYCKRDGFTTFADSELKDYERFKNILMEFRSFYGLEEYNLKEIDKYIWQLGKEYFPNNYKKSKDK